VAISTVIKTRRDGKITLSDNGAANTLVIDYEAGDFSMTVGGASVSLFLNRGKIGATPSIRYNEDQPITFSFSAYFRDLSDAGYETLSEVLLQSGAVGSGWVSTMGANGEVFAIDVGILIEGTDHGDASDHSFTLPNCVVTGSWAEGEPNTISVSGTSYALLPTSIA